MPFDFLGEEITEEQLEALHGQPGWLNHSANFIIDGGHLNVTAAFDGQNPNEDDPPRPYYLAVALSSEVPSHSGMNQLAGRYPTKSACVSAYRSTLDAILALEA